MIAKLEWTQSNAQQNVEQLQNPTLRGTIKKQTAAQATGGLNKLIGTKYPP